MRIFSQAGLASGLDVMVGMRISMRSAKSATQRIRPPALINVLPADWVADISIRLTDAFMPYSAARADGVTIEPSDSTPMDHGAKPTATPTALPLEDPPGV
ncbi:hypothetical protein RRF57_012011 [Xylaria bambusicola]|uniref:Uncharacterized protein n=1 Tax=Xylaria bambusicola TaxID=326684 RepID=A0AAN7V3E5_9PEZI